MKEDERGNDGNAVPRRRRRVFCGVHLQNFKVGAALSAEALDDRGDLFARLTMRREEIDENRSGMLQDLCVELIVVHKRDAFAIHKESPCNDAA